MSLHEQGLQVRAERSFGLIVGAIVAVFGARLMFRENFGIIGPSLVAFGVLLISLGAFYPKALILPARLWMGLAEVLAFVSTRLTLAVIFFVIITPIGFVKRLFGWDPLQRHSTLRSYWVTYSPRQLDSRHYEKMF